MKNYILGLIFVTGCLFLGCEEELTFTGNNSHHQYVKSDAGSSPYFPYEVGKKWNYVVYNTTEYDYPEGGPLEDTIFEFSSTRENEVLRQTQLTGLNPLDVWEQRTYMSSDYVDTTIYQYVHIEGDSVYTYLNLDDSDPTYVFPSNPGLGDQWSIEDGTMLFEVVADDSKANGFENCLKIEVTPEDIGTYDEYLYYQYWAEGEGVVLTTFYGLMKTLLDQDTTYITQTMEDRLITSTGIKE